MTSLEQLPLTGHALQVAVGDLIHTSGNFHPHYRIISLAGDKAWIRDTQYGLDCVVPIASCHAIQGGAQ